MATHDEQRQDHGGLRRVRPGVDLAGVSDVYLLVSKSSETPAGSLADRSGCLVMSVWLVVDEEPHPSLFSPGRCSY